MSVLEGLAGAGIVGAAFAFVTREVAQAIRDSRQRQRELRGLMRILWSELLFNSQTVTFLAGNPQRIMAKELPELENGAWKDHGGRMAQLLPAEDFTALATYY